MADRSTNPSDPGAEVTALAQGIGEALRRLQTLPEPQRTTALAAVEGIEALHQDALSRMIGHLSRDERGAQLLGELLTDPVVATVFAVHGFLRAPDGSDPGQPERLPSDPSRMVIRIDPRGP